MAFIRSYSRRAAGELFDTGDPGFLKGLKKRFKLPKAIRKFQPGKAIAKIAPTLLPLVGGPIGMLGGGLLSRLAQKYQVPLEYVQGIAEQYGYSEADQGDIYDIGDAKPKKTPKRKKAAIGTKTKAKAKAKTKRPPKGVRRPSGSRQGLDLGKIAESATSLLPVGGALADEIIRQVKGARGGGEIPDLAGIAGGSFRVPRGGFGGGHRRRTINPTNVKALRRSLRRVEGFKSLVKRVEKQFPAMRSHPRASSRGSGHRHGCRCAACKRAA